MDQALLITGTVGAGKTTVADALGDLLAGRAVPHAVIDIDRLRHSWPSPPGDPFRHDLALANVAAVTRNYAATGARRLVLAGVVESHEERADYARAVGVPLRVCRLIVGLAVVRDRLTARHHHDPDALRWHLARSGDLDTILTHAAVEDTTVEAGDAPPPEVARRVAAAAGW
ncbi:adenylyl-sulfate kinase [Symbioplanes lichenis]|uniref:adenylyl-sulfate kinase n=1 Tax=Symbioplanes lichenis TaxID=1629072 RepID=UPI002739E3CE|nr:adenylyl-sulfate kinase [Actinoplanes lichenis]